MSVFAGVALTSETIAATREHFIEIYRGCIEEVTSGAVYVNDLASYIAWRERQIEDMRVKEQFTFTFLQCAHWLQTGEMIPLLPGGKS